MSGETGQPAPAFNASRPSGRQNSQLRSTDYTNLWLRAAALSLTRTSPAFGVGTGTLCSVAGA